MTDQDIVTASERLLRPYHIPRECPYLSENQRELSTLDLKGRSAWMAEWLMLASALPPLRHSFRIAAQTPARLRKDTTAGGPGS